MHLSYSTLLSLNTHLCFPLPPSKHQSHSVHHWQNQHRFVWELKFKDSRSVMALARLAFKNLQQKLASTSSSPLSQTFSERALNAVQKRTWGSELLRSLTSVTGEEKLGREVAVSEGGKKSKLFPRRRHRGSLWRRNNDDFRPSLSQFLPSGVGNALMRASENINRLVENLAPNSQLTGSVKEQDECYKLRYNVPGLGKDDVKITVEDGILSIKGEHKEEDEEGSDDEYWSARSYGYYNNSVMLPDDAKVDEIKAEMKDGVLSVIIPRTEKPKKDVKEVRVN